MFKNVEIVNDDDDDDNNEDDNDSTITRMTLKGTLEKAHEIFNNLLNAPQTFPSAHALLAKAQSCADHVQHRTFNTCDMLCATWCEVAVQP